ncbi:hypothetical protein [Candidatus Thioglobus autotrophicus]|uniref:hypothetical protein n=1 Tax=Candidatus Thioglobus autotrophicus TaxID=1705394 RepID=UPI00299D96CF|nr:hypothetical protein [Candidatus Thioglobus autotrophicus]WPE16352.1 hypothetical protein R5P06_07315 [Candidatus Thioglobus autotrophicus]WPE17899.1 hypothetical protein R5P05_07470 [Candidatus Thioglobus autotrophicus]
MKKVQNITAAILLGSALVLPTSVSAFGGFSLPSVPGLGGGSSSSVDAGELTARTESAISDFAKSLGLFQKALKLDIDADKEKKLAECGSGSGCISSDTMDTITSVSEEVNRAMEEMKNNGEVMDEDAKAQFAKGLLPYGKGTLIGITVLKDLPDALKSDPMALMSLIKVPSMLTNFMASSGTVYDYATSNGVEVPEGDGPR